MPVYNAGSFLHASIASVKAQHVTDWELIVVNDGSTDDSQEVLEAYAKADPRIHVATQENRGQFFARRRGIDLARGEYVVFLDSDDALTPDCLTTLQAAIQRGAWDMILYTGRIIRNGAETERIFGQISPHEQTVPVKWIRERLISTNDLNSLCIKAFRRELFGGDQTDYSAFEGTRCGEDKVQLLYPVTKAANILYLPDCLYCYHYRMDSTMHRFEEKAISRMLAEEMFPLLRLFMQKWGMDDLEHQEQLAAYRIKQYLSVYFGFRRCCHTLQQWRAFRRYPWRTHWRQLAGCCRCAKKRLSLRDRTRLFAAKMQL